VWIFHRVLGAPEYGQSEVRAADALLDARAIDVAQKLRARRLWSLPRAGEAVPAAEQRAGNGLAAGHVREREPPEEARDLVIRGEGLNHAGVPVPLQLHCCLAVAEQ